MHHPVHLTFTTKQMHKLAKGGAVNLLHEQLLTGHPVILHKTKVRKIHKAHREGKGTRVHFSPEELELTMQHGSGPFLDFLKKAGTWVKKNVIDTPLYQNTFKPIVHGLVDQGINAASALVGSKTGPLGQKIAQDVANAAANKVYEKTGVGIRGRTKHARGGTLLMDNNYAPKGSALNPAQPLPPIGANNPSIPAAEMYSEHHGYHAHHATPGPRRSRFVKGSAEAMAWAQEMKRKREAKRSGAGFRPAGAY